MLQFKESYTRRALAGRKFPSYKRCTHILASVTPSLGNCMGVCVSELHKGMQTLVCEREGGYGG